MAIGFIIMGIFMGAFMSGMPIFIGFMGIVIMGAGMSFIIIHQPGLPWKIIFSGPSRSILSMAKLAGAAAATNTAAVRTVSSFISIPPGCETNRANQSRLLQAIHEQVFFAPAAASANVHSENWLFGGRLFRPVATVAIHDIAAADLDRPCRPSIRECRSP
jgi:hypothetical protein